jgi:L-asparaginase II
VQAPPVLLEVRRGDVVESRHRGSLVVLAADGTVTATAGEPDATTFPRSCLKPLQAVAMLEQGFAGDDASVALAAASHDGEDVHVSGARRTLAAGGLDDAALQCPPALPASVAAAETWIRAGGGPAAVCHNCSGKHAAMLATCAINGWPLDSYRDPAHPLQVAIRATVERLCGEPVRATTVDGCGAPAFAVSLTGLARAFARIATAPDGSPEARVRTAMQAHPRLVGGSGRAVTDFLGAVPGLVCKDGAECVWGAALADGRAFAVKAEDGGARALPPLLAAALAHWGSSAPAVARWATVPVLGGGAPVGAIEWSPYLRELLDLQA